MKASSLPNLHGKITNNNRLKIELTKAINQAAMYAKRGTGTAQVANDLDALLVAARAQLAAFLVV